MSNSETNVYPIVIFLPTNGLFENCLICGEITVDDVMRTKNYFAHSYLEHVTTVPDNTIGTIGNIPKETKRDWLRLKIHDSKPVIDEVISDNRNISADEYQVILYDKPRFQRSQLLLPSEVDCNSKSSTNSKGTDHFKCLVKFLQVSCSDTKSILDHPVIELFLLRVTIFLKIVDSFLGKVLFVLKLSTLAIHMTSILHTAIWSVETFLKNKGRLTLKSGNYILAVMTDCVGGMLIIYWFINSINFEDILEFLTSQSEVRSL